MISETSHQLCVFFEKAVLKIFRKFVEKHSWQSSYSTYLQTFKLANMLNTVFPQISPGPHKRLPLTVLHLTVWKFNKCQGCLLVEEIRWALLSMFFMELFENFQNSYVKEQSNFHAVVVFHLMLKINSTTGNGFLLLPL